jgi:uncharacterized tellurite resistance protein B-like protein
MLDRIQQFFESNILADTGGAQTDAHGTALAAAALLVEMARIDDEVLDIEQATLLSLLREQFDLTEAEASDLVDLADEETRAAGDYYQFTSLINQQFSPVQKLAVLENLWRVAYADAHISAHERHLMRKLADLLHIPHGDHMLAKDRAKAAIQTQPGDTSN